MRFMHIADVHLGYQQYGSKERFNDFSHVFLHVTDQAIEQQVDFVLLAGDLFEKRTVDPLAMRVAIEGLEKLKKASIPVLAVEGNHERARYRDQYSWMDFLDAVGYLYLLNPAIKKGHAVLEPHNGAGGAYVDLTGGVRVYGIKYYGASTGKVFKLFADALDETDHSAVQFAILMSHAGLEGQQPRFSGTLTHNDLASLRGKIHYLALGHLHKPYELDGWIYNPGSLETCSMKETAWPERGYYLVDVQPGQRPNHRTQLIAPPRRPFHRLRLKVDALTEPKALYDAVRKLIKRRYAEIAHNPAPVIELTLSGVLPFNRFDLDLDYVKRLLEDACNPLIARVRETITPVEFEIPVDAELNREELERNVIQELLERDARFRPLAAEWTRVALEIKRLALEGNDPKVITDYLRQSRAELVPPAHQGGA